MAHCCIPYIAQADGDPHPLLSWLYFILDVILCNPLGRVDIDCECVYNLCKSHLLLVCKLRESVDSLSYKMHSLLVLIAN